MTTSTQVANQAIMLMGDNQPLITGVAPTFDDSAAGVALQYLYAPCVATVVKQFEYEFARNTVTLSLTGNTAPVPWNFEYSYPAAAVEILQLIPGGTVLDPNNPLPTTWIVANNLVSGTQTRVIQTNLASAKAVINNNPSESAWDAEFQEAVVRLLSSELAIAVAGKPETSSVLLESASMFAAISKVRGA